MSDKDESQGDNQELQALMMQAKQVDGDQAAQAPGAVMEAQEQAEAISLAQTNQQGVAMILDMALPILGTMYPSLETVYTPEARAAVAASLGPVMAKYGINLQEWGGRYQEEIGALFVCGPIAWATVKAVKTDIMARQAAQPSAVTKGERAAVQAPPAVAGDLQPGDYGYREPVLA
ncbi:MAG: hypothetical protein ACXW2U_00805 [Telluria sp.]